MPTISIPESHMHYFKHFSTFHMNAICANNNNCGYVPHKIIDLHLDMAECTEQENGIQQLKTLFDEKVPVEVDSYDGFKIVRIGTPKAIWLPDEKACSFIRDDLERYNGMLAYWDSVSIAFVVQQPRLAEMLRQFLSNVSYVSYCSNRGLTLK